MLSMSRNFYKYVAAVFICILSGYVIVSFPQYTFNILLGCVGLIFIQAVFLPGKPDYLLYLILSAAMLTSGIQRGFLIPSIQLRPNELALIALAGIVFVRGLLFTRASNRLSIAFGPIDLIFFVIFIGRGLIPSFVYLVRGNSFSMADIVTIFGFVQYYILYRVVLITIATKNASKTVIRVLILLSAIVAVLALFQALNVFGVRELLTTLKIGDGNIAFGAMQDYYVDRGRAYSLLGAWNTLGAYMAMNLSIIYVFYLCIKKGKKESFFLLVAFMLDVIGLLASGSFTGVALFVIGILIATILGQRVTGRAALSLTLVISVVLVLGLGVYLMRSGIQNRLAQQYGGNDVNLLLPSTLQVRIGLWMSVFIPYIKSSMGELFLGLGPKGIALEENYYLYLITRSGLLGLCAYLFAIFYLIKLMYKYSNKKYKGLLGPLALMSFILVVQLSIASLTGLYFDYSGVAETIWVILALWFVNRHLDMNKESVNVV